MAAPATPEEFIARCNAVVAEIAVLHEVWPEIRNVAAANNDAKENIDNAHTEMMAACSEHVGGKRRSKRRISKRRTTRRH
jgi:hypothetical protein